MGFSVLNFPNFAKENIEKMLIPYKYQISLPIEKLGYAYIKGFNYWMNLPSDLIKMVENIWLAGYEASAIFDDLIDESDYRRNFPSSPKMFGKTRSIIYSHAYYFFILKKLMELKNEKVTEMYVDNLIMYLAGVNQEVDNNHYKICPNLADYEQICIHKTSGITNLPINLMQILSNCKTDFSALSDLFNIHLQYTCDASMLCDRKIWDSKAFCEDISEGNFNLATIHAVNSGTLEGEIVYNIVTSKTKDLPTLKYCLSLLEKLGSIEFAKEMTISTENKIREEIKRLGGNPPLVEYLDKLVAWSYDERYPIAKNDPIVSESDRN